MGTGIGLFLPWENGTELLGLGFAHLELGKKEMKWEWDNFL